MKINSFVFIQSHVIKIIEKNKKIKNNFFITFPLFINKYHITFFSCTMCFSSSIQICMQFTNKMFNLYFAILIID